MGASGTNSLNFRANLDISDAKKNARELLKIYKDLKIESSSITSGPGTNSSQGISAYRQAQLEMQKALRDSRLETERLKQEQARLRAELEQGRVAQQANRTEVERLRASEQALRVELQQGRITQQQFNAQLAQGRIAQQGLNAQLVQGRVDAQNARTQMAELTLEQRRQSIAARQARDAQRTVSGSYREAQQRLAALGAEIRNTTNGFRSQTPELQAKIREYNRLNQALKDFDASMGNHQRNVGNYTGALNGIVGTLSGLAAGFISAGAIIGASFSTALRTDAIKTSLEFTFNSVDIAKKKMDDLRFTADRLGLEYVSLADSYRSFAGAAVASNFPLKETDRIFNAVANAGAKLKLTSDQVGGALTALQQMISKGNVQSEELRGQLGERLPGAFAIAARAMGVTQQELGKLLKDGDVLAADLLPKLAIELDKTFSNDKTEKVKSMQGSVNSLKNSFSEMVETKGALSAFFTFLLDRLGGVTRGIAKMSQALGIFYDLATDPKKLIRDSAKDSRDASFEELKKNAEQSAKTQIANAVGKKQAYELLQREAKLLGELNDKYKELKSNYEQKKQGDRSLIETQNLQEQEKSLKFQKQLVRGLNSEFEKMYVVRKSIKEIDDADLRSVAEIRKRISELKKLDGSAIFGDKIYNRIQALQDRLKKPTELNTDPIIKSRNSLQKEINDLIDASTKKQLSADDAEVKSVTDKYQKMREKAIEFNNSAAAKKAGVRVDIGGIAVAEKSEKQAVIDKQSNERFKSLLAEQAKDFEEFENYKIKFGAEAAEKRFGKEFTTGEAYSRKLEDLQTKLLSEIADPAQATESQKQELAVITDAIKQDTDRRKAMQDANYAEARQAAMTNAEEMLKIEQDYQKNLVALGENATKEQLEVLDKGRKKAISALATDELMDSDAWKNLFSDLDNLSVSQIENLIKEIEVNFDSLKGKFNPIDIAEILKKLQEAKNVIIERNPFAQVGDAIKAVFSEGASGAKKSAEEIKKDWLNLANSTAAAFAFVDNAIESCDILKEAIGEVGASALSSLSAISRAGLSVMTAVTAANAAAATTAIATSAAIKTAEKASVVLAVISAALVVVQAISGLFKSIFNAHDKRIEKSIEKHKEQVESLGSAYNRLERDVNNAVGKAVEQAHLRQIENLKQQQAELEKIREAESRKKKPDQGKINDVNEQIASIGDKIQDTQKAMIEALTGTTARSISDGIISGFKNGKRAAADFADDFNGLMEDALLNALKTNFLDVEIANFYKRFAEASKDGLTKEEAERLRNEYTGIINEGLKLVKDIDKITGGPKKDPVVNPDDSKSSEGRLRAALTEETGSKLEGLWRGQFDMTKQLVMLSTERNTLLTPIGKTIGELYSIAKGNFDVAVKTEANTRRTADNTEGVGKKLDQIITNTKPPSTTRVLGI